VLFKLLLKLDIAFYNICGIAFLLHTFIRFRDCICNQGRDEGAEIDQWEDPAFEVYHVTDRYGFIQWVFISMPAFINIH